MTAAQLREQIAQLERDGYLELRDQHGHRVGCLESLSHLMAGQMLENGRGGAPRFIRERVVAVVRQQFGRGAYEQRWIGQQTTLPH